MIRPGPERITPGACPGGVVIHVYTATDQPTLVLARPIGPGVDAGPIAVADAIHAAGLTSSGAWCLVAYDGDTGHRFDRAAWGARP